MLKPTEYILLDDEQSATVVNNLVALCDNLKLYYQIVSANEHNAAARVAEVEEFKDEMLHSADFELYVNVTFKKLRKDFRFWRKYCR